MDFKIAGTPYGVTAMQLDVKHPLPLSIVMEAIYLARDGRNVILETMMEQTQNTVLGGLKPRTTTKESAPSVEVVRFDTMRKRDLIGPGGAVLRQIEDRYGISLDLSQEGRCLLYGTNRKMVAKAKATVMELVSDVVQGEKYEGTVVEVKDYGAVVELLRNKEGLLHVSEYATMSTNHNNNMTMMSSSKYSNNHNNSHMRMEREVLTVGQKIEVLCIGIDPVEGSVKLSRKHLQSE
jgi:polyribonucleotide nucleotidyltransferase